MEEINDFESIDQFLEQTRRILDSDGLFREDILAMNRNFGEEFLLNTLQGHCFRKPHGYAGDFEIIEKIYTRHINPDPEYKFWDEYFQQHEAPEAVRKRKDMFVDIIDNKINEKEKFELLNIACGPARDLSEVYLNINTGILKTTCIEYDSKAIDYAKKLNDKYLKDIIFEHRNIIRYQTEKKYDLIWSGGVFDYFDIKLSIGLLKRFKEWLKPGGEIIIGNFNKDHNPSENFMNIFGDWILNYKSEEEMLNMAKQVGFKEDQISLTKGYKNIILYLHLRNV